MLRHWDGLGIPSDATVFVPLCGKSGDLIWLAQQGHKVVGAELSEIAVKEFFTESSLEPKVYDEGEFKCYESGPIKLYCGDFFKLKAFQIEEIAGVYDRAALIALPSPMRKSYVEHLNTLLKPKTRALLVTLEYDEEVMQGPPFCVRSEEVTYLFNATTEIEALQSESIEFKDEDCIERVWSLVWR